MTDDHTPYKAIACMCVQELCSISCYFYPTAIRGQANIYYRALRIPCQALTLQSVIGLLFTLYALNISALPRSGST
jgi:hypothetical protein